jgi:hypothetical protein
LVIKHRQLVCQVGAFGDFAIKSSMDLDININFSLVFEFVFGSWVCIADEKAKLQGHLMEIQANQALPAQSEDALDDLVEKIQDFSIFDSTMIRFDEFESYSDLVTGAVL